MERTCEESWRDESNEPGASRNKKLLLPTRMIPIVRLLLVLSATVSRANCKPRPDTSRDCAHSESTLERSATTGMESEMVTGTISADGNVAITILEELENRLSRLERRLRAVEQPGKRSFLSRPSFLLFPLFFCFFFCFFFINRIVHVIVSKHVENTNGSQFGR